MEPMIVSSSSMSPCSRSRPGVALETTTGLPPQRRLRLCFAGRLPIGLHHYTTPTPPHPTHPHLNCTRDILAYSTRGASSVRLWYPPLDPQHHLIP